MRWLVVVTLLALGLAACGGSSAGRRGSVSCSVYDRNGAAYVTLSGTGTQLQATQACAKLGREWSAEGSFWSPFRGAGSYGADVRICATRHRGTELDVFDRHPTSQAGTSICAWLTSHGWAQVG